MIREYKIKIDDELLHGHTPTEFRQPTDSDESVVSNDGKIDPGRWFGLGCGPRLILSPPKAEPISIDLAALLNIFETSESGMARIAGMFGTIAGQLRRLAEGQVSL